MVHLFNQCSKKAITTCTIATAVLATTILCLRWQFKHESWYDSNTKNVTKAQHIEADTIVFVGGASIITLIAVIYQSTRKSPNTEASIDSPSAPLLTN